MDPSLLFSASKKRPSNQSHVVILASDSEDESHDKLSPAKLSFEDSNEGIEKSFLGRHEVTFHSSSSENDVEEASKGLESIIVEEWEAKDPDQSDIKSPLVSATPSPVKPSKKNKKIRKRITALASSSSEDDDDKENIGTNCSFDIGAIKRQFATPKPSVSRKNCDKNQDDSEYRDANQYDLQDSFINDESLSEEETCSSEDEASFEAEVPTSERKAQNVSSSESEEEKVVVKKKPQKQNVVRVKTIETKTFLDSLGDIEPSAQTHPDASKYLKSYSRYKCELADFLFKLFNEQIFNGCLPHNMPLIWKKTLNKTAGRCVMKKIRKGSEWDRLCEIELASKVLTSADRLRDTLIHEMCHAACWLLNSVQGGHGHLWQSWSKMAMLQFPELPIISRCHDYAIETKFAYVCFDCKHHYKRHSKSINTTEKRCGKCKGYGKGRLELHIWDKKVNCYVPYNVDEGGILNTPAGKKNKFAAFVKDNYKFSRTPGRTHQEAMKELSKKFAETKLNKE